MVNEDWKAKDNSGSFESIVGGIEKLAWNDNRVKQGFSKITFLSSWFACQVQLYKQELKMSFSLKTLPQILACYKRVTLITIRRGFMFLLIHSCSFSSSFPVLFTFQKWHGNHSNIPWIWKPKLCLTQLESTDFMVKRNKPFSFASTFFQLKFCC